MEHWLRSLCTSVLLYSCMAYWCKKTLSIVLQPPPTLGPYEGPAPCSFPIPHLLNPIPASPRYCSYAHDRTLTVTAGSSKAETESEPTTYSAHPSNGCLPGGASNCFECSKCLGLLIPRMLCDACQVSKLSKNVEAIKFIGGPLSIPSIVWPFTTLSIPTDNSRILRGTRKANVKGGARKDSHKFQGQQSDQGV